MRFKLSLTLTRDSGNVLPINYQYEQSAVIYRILSRSDELYSAWLHDNGYRLESGKKFKLFTYSPFKLEKFRILKSTAQIEILGYNVEWKISFQPEKATEEFVRSIFTNQLFEIGNRDGKVKFQVQQVEVLPEPQFSEIMNYRTLSPICLPVSLDGNRYDTYISPDNPRATIVAQMNLIEKYRAIKGKEFPDTDFTFQMEVLDKPKPKLITIKAGTPEESKVRGFNCRFTLTAPPELQKIAYQTGLGSKNSLGFGMIEEN